MNLHKKNQKHHINSFKSDQLTKYLSSEIFVTISDFNDAWLHVKQYHIENDKYYVDIGRAHV